MPSNLFRISSALNNRRRTSRTASIAITTVLQPPKWQRKVRFHSINCRYHGFSSRDPLSLARCANFTRRSEIPYHGRSPHLHGHDRLLPHNDPAPYAPAFEHVEIRPCCQEEGAVPGGDEGWTREIIYQRPSGQFFILSAHGLSDVFRKYYSRLRLLSTYSISRSFLPSRTILRLLCS